MFKKRGEDADTPPPAQRVGDAEEISALLLVITTLEWFVFTASIPVFKNVNLFYYPAWIFGFIAFLFYSYLMIEVGFLKCFYRFRNPRVAQQRLDARRMVYRAQSVDTES